MTSHWDEFSKSVADAVPRRESLLRLGAVLAGAVLGPLGIETVRAGHRTSDPCKTFCRCRSKSQQNQCLSTCRACGKNSNRLCGTGCGNYFCCSGGTVCCGSYCADLEGDPYNCGACGYECDPPGPWEEGACLLGTCVSACIPGAFRCDGVCTDLAWDHDNCGACGRVCGPNTDCYYGECIDSTGEY